MISNKLNQERKMENYMFGELPNDLPPEIFTCRCVVNPFATSFRFVKPQVACHSELWHLMELRIQNSYGSIRQIDWVCGVDEIEMLKSASNTRGAFELGSLCGVEEWRN